MLQAVSNLAPRGVYVCGNTTTTSGLTVSHFSSVETENQIFERKRSARHYQTEKVTERPAGIQTGDPSLAGP